MSNILLLILFASISAFSRGIISVIDRYQMAYRKQGIIEVNLINNLSSILLVTILFFFMLRNYSLPHLSTFYFVKIILYALVVQLVAYGYSYVYKKISIMQAVLVNKLSDLFIPIAIFLTAGYLNLHSYFVSITSTLIIVIYIYYQEKHATIDINLLTKSFLVIVPLLVFQSAISPILTKGVSGIVNLIFFTIFTIYIRGIIAIIVFYLKNKHLTSLNEKRNKQVVLIYSTRAILTLLAQITYTLATSSAQSSIAWVFLNLTALYSVFLGEIFLHEKLKLWDILIIVAIFVIALIAK
ncbi:EamA family transporter [Lactobacillus mulieris]|uniref:EamA family transporter n=1 Tax=Lactobacillus mulieris TaxID=2508708 RepID=A0AAW5WZ37_9LACO|nr:EamA family transporter [Lactobacillus mulieris]MCZ3622584.1 EamA family transporter [Lactobacillus mulieris]MCZ3624222.1 EamA family transporter [Lactobacillus mulieris]MCZ3636591.1 EamA family transporter [Lactobacillus mulieris]MCZ3690348.1 EamA family transporter [Lactobacillus mulieris]MCZ3696317.1 EamA family transporter [Lactobacillus mulieris]